MNSEDEAFDPFPNCVMGRTGCHARSYYYIKYSLDETFSTFFKIDTNAQLTKSEIDDIIIQYAEEYSSISKPHDSISYNEPLWNLFEIKKETPLKLYQLERYFLKFLIQDSESD